MTERKFTWQLDRPLAVFDIEATGTGPRADRIVELAVIKLLPDNTRTIHVWRVNPGVPIPPEATAIHGISDQDVADSPSFAMIAVQVVDVLEGCDLGGYNVLRFDIPMLEEEFTRANIRFELKGRRIVDAQRIYHMKEPRDLKAALAYYCGEDLQDAHNAQSDTAATIRVLEGQFMKYSDLPRDMTELDALCNPVNPSYVDRTGRLKWANNEPVINFGKKKGTALRYLVEHDPSFLKWMLRSDFPRDTKEIVQNAMAGVWPVPE